MSENRPFAIFVKTNEIKSPSGDVGEKKGEKHEAEIMNSESEICLPFAKSEVFK